MMSSQVLNTLPKRDGQMIAKQVLILYNVL